jgi:hypothetical protein
MSELATLLGYVNYAVFFFAAFNWWQAYENRAPNVDLRTFRWSLDAAFDEQRFTVEGRKYQRRFVQGMGGFFAILVAVLALQLAPSLLN